MMRKLVHRAFYVVLDSNGEKSVWQWWDDFWLRCGDEEKVPLDWATVIRRVRL